MLVVHLIVLSTPVGPPRVGFVVAKSVGPAVTRNLVKRRLRHLVRDELASLPGSALVVVRAQPGAATASYPELRAELARCLGRAREQVSVA